MEDLEEFPSGAIRQAIKGRFDLISPVGIRRLAETYAEGAAKYSDRNWEKGMPVSSVLNHVLQHIFKYLDGDTSEDHLAHAAWGLFAVMHFEEKKPEMLEK